MYIVDIKLENTTKIFIYLNHESSVSNNFCIIDSSKNSYVRKLGKNKQKDYCNKK